MVGVSTGSYQDQPTAERGGVPREQQSLYTAGTALLKVMATDD